MFKGKWFHSLLTNTGTFVVLPLNSMTDFMFIWIRFNTSNILNFIPFNEHEYQGGSNVGQSNQFYVEPNAYNTLDTPKINFTMAWHSGKKVLDKQ